MDLTTAATAEHAKKHAAAKTEKEMEQAGLTRDGKRPAGPGPSGVMGRFGVSAEELGQQRRAKDPKSREKRTSQYLESLINRFRHPNSFKFMRRSTNAQHPGGKDEPPPIVPVEEKYQQILKIIENCFESNINSYILLTGSEGNGRSSAVYFAMNAIFERDQRKKLQPGFADRTNTERQALEHKKLQKNSEKFPSLPDAGAPAGPEEPQKEIKFIEVDAFIYKEEGKILNHIINLLTAGLDESAAEESNKYLKLIDFMKNYRLVLYIKNIDVFTEESRQVFLYSLLDNVNNFAMKTCIIFSTNNLFFLNKLEKRVKSRFSYKNFVFEGFDLEDHLLPILKSRLDLPNYHEDAKPLLAAFDDVRVLGFLSRYHQLGMSISWFINLAKTALLLCTAADFLVEVQRGGLAEYLLKKLEEAKKMILFEGGDAEILRHMPRPAKLVMLVLHERALGKAVDAGLPFEQFNKKMKEVVSQKFSSTFSRHSWENFSSNVIKENLLTLKKMNYLHLDKTPITMETVIQLNDSVSPTFLTVKVQDSDILFD